MTDLCEARNAEVLDAIHDVLDNICVDMAGVNCVSQKIYDAVTEVLRNQALEGLANRPRRSNPRVWAE